MSRADKKAAKQQAKRAKAVAKFKKANRAQIPGREPGDPIKADNMPDHTVTEHRGRFGTKITKHQGEFDL